VPILLRKFRELKVSVCLFILRYLQGPDAATGPGNVALVSASRPGRVPP
jgi:hypothetical protein